MSGGSLTATALDDAIAEAKAEGFDVVRSDDRTLLLDLDTPESLAQYKRVLPLLLEHFNVDALTKWKSKSGNTHVSIKLTDTYPPMVRFALQAALGSDAVRELLIVLQHLNGCNEPSLLFRPKTQEIT